jgi:hypothetical protein
MWELLAYLPCDTLVADRGYLQAAPFATKAEPELVLERQLADDVHI